jgi:carboxymethylenebutenolidase
MMEYSITTQKVQFPSKNIDINGYLAMPDTEGTFSAVIVIQEIFGVNSHIRDVTERMAKQGYVAIAPAIYQRLAPNFETGYTAEAIEMGRKYKDQTKAKELLQDIQCTINYLYTLPQVKKTGVGSIGFCFGGHVTYLAATLEDIKATASFYGAGITHWCPGENTPTINQTAQIKGTIYTFFGTEDDSIPLEQVKEIEETLQKYKIDHQVFCYEGADHGFFCDQRSSYNKIAAQSAWKKVLTLFKDRLN